MNNLIFDTYKLLEISFIYNKIVCLFLINN